MANIEHNRRLWNDDFDWSQKGEPWSTAWGGSGPHWRFSVFPRITRFFPTVTLLEIAPGFGRWTHWLRPHCQRLVGIDVSAKCVEACRARFSGDCGAEFHVNDGRSLQAVEDGSVDFVFSYDSLVHAEADVLEAYLRELARKLKPEGGGFIHHSNLGEAVAEGRSVPQDHGRASSMTAKLFERFAQAAGLRCVSQEIVAWGGSLGIDCLSVVVCAGSPFARPNRVLRNDEFMREAAYIRRLSALYSE